MSNVLLFIHIISLIYLPGIEVLSHLNKVENNSFGQKLHIYIIKTGKAISRLFQSQKGHFLNCDIDHVLCSCHGGGWVRCQSKASCPAPPCVDYVKRAGDCCYTCPNGIILL